MERYTNFILRHRKMIIAVFVVLTILCAGLSTFVGVNYKFADYLPDDAASTKALDVMEEEYDQPIPNMRVMIYDVSIPEALDYKEQIENVEGVTEVNWLDDAIDIYSPLEEADEDTVNEWYKDSNALFSVTIQDDSVIKEAAVEEIRDIIGDDNAMSGTAVTDVLSPVHTSADIQKILLIVIPIVFIVLFLTTTSWFEPILFMVTIGIAIMLNRGTNLIFGEISFVTNAAGSVLQLAVSMDYSIFLLHRFSENRSEGKDVQEAMVSAVKQSTSSVLSSGLTTVTGFAALILMRFKIGPDMGWVMAKAIVFSLICVLCLLPALAITTYKWIDKTQHKPLYPDFHKLSKGVMKVRIPALVLAAVIAVPCFIAQGKNSFLYGSSRVYSTEETQMGRDLLAIEEEYGASNPIVIMVPIGDMSKEIALNEELKSNENVTSVISYVNSVGAEIPEEFVPSESLSQLYSENYSRFVVSLDTEESEEGWDEKLDEIHAICEKYYGDEALIAGDLASTEDLKDTITVDNTRVNLLAIAFVFLILVVNFKSLVIPVILTLVIELSIWINLAIPYFGSTTLHYISYLIISSVQLGATIDYAILYTSRYLELRETETRHEAARKSIQLCVLSLFTSAIILTIAGFVLGGISTNLVLSQLGTLVGRGAVISFLLVMTVLPALLIVFDKVIERTTFHKEEKHHEQKQKKLQQKIAD